MRAYVCARPPAVCLPAVCGNLRIPGDLLHVMCRARSRPLASLAVFGGVEGRSPRWRGEKPHSMNHPCHSLFPDSNSGDKHVS